MFIVEIKQLQPTVQQFIQTDGKVDCGKNIEKDDRFEWEDIQVWKVVDSAVFVDFVEDKCERHGEIKKYT